MNASPSSVRSRLSHDDRRRQLIDVAMQLFSRHGFSGTTTRQIAVAAGVTEALIFRFFPRKEDLYAALLDRKSADAGTEEWVEELRRAAARGDDRAVIRGVVSHILEHQAQDAEFTRLMLFSALEDHSMAREYRERHFAPLRQFLVSYVRAQQRAGVFRRGDPLRLVRAILAIPVYDGLVETLVTEDSLPRTTGAADVYTDFILAGLKLA